MFGRGQSRLEGMIYCIGHSGRRVRALLPDDSIRCIAGATVQRVAAPTGA